MQLERDLTGGVSVRVHTRTGFDSLVALSVIEKVRFAVGKVYEMYGRSWEAYISDFGACVAQTDSVDGLKFVWPSNADTGEVLAEAFKLWLALPDSIVNNWRKAVGFEEVYNAPDLLPSGKVAPDVLNNPLPLSAESSSGAA